MKGLDHILNYFIDFSQQRVQLHTLMQILKITVTGAVSKYPVCILLVLQTQCIATWSRLQTDLYLMSVNECFELLEANSCTEILRFYYAFIDKYINKEGCYYVLPSAVKSKYNTDCVYPQRQ